MTSGTRWGGADDASVARGTLADVPIAHVLLHLRAKELSGILELRALDGGHAWVAFARGAVTTIQTTPTIARFGTVVYELGLIDAGTLEETTVTAAREERAHVDVILERGVLGEHDRERVVVEQTRRRIHRLFQLPSATVFTFREVRPSRTAPAVAVDVLAPVWRGLSDFPPRARIGEVLDAVAGRKLELVSAAILDDADLRPAEVALLERVSDQPMTLDEIRVRAGDPPLSAALDPMRVDLLVYFALVARCVHPIGEGPRPTMSDEMWSVAYEGPLEPPTDPPMVVHASMARIVGQLAPHEMTEEEVEARAAAIEHASPYAALGLAEGASLEAVRAAFFRLARLWSPRNLPPHLTAARGAAERIHRRMTEAHRTLADAHLHAPRSGHASKA